MKFEPETCIVKNLFLQIHFEMQTVNLILLSLINATCTLHNFTNRCYHSELL